MFLTKSEMRRSIGKERDYAHEKAYAAPHRGSTTQKLQGRDDDRDRSWTPGAITAHSTKLVKLPTGVVSQLTPFYRKFATRLVPVPAACNDCKRRTSSR